MTWKLLSSLLLFACLGLAEHKLESAGTPPAEVPAPIAALLQKEGHRILGDDGKPVLEIWLRNELPSGRTTKEENATFDSIPHGALLGVLRFPVAGTDRRGQSIKAGIYTLRYSLFPINGDHQGVAPQRDFLLLSPIGEDTDPTSTPDFKTLTTLSMKASRTPHPAVLSFWKAEAGGKPGLEQDGEDWVLRAKIGDTLVAIIVVGQVEG